MFLLSRRQVHAALAGAGATLAYLAAAEVGSRKPVRVGGLVVLSSMALAGLMSSQSSVKARNTEARLNGFFDNGGSVGGNFVVNGNHTITGSLFGSAGTITAGDAIHVNGNPLTADGTITSHADINATTGTITGGTVVSNGDVQATSGTVHAGGLSTTGAVHGGSTTGDSTQGNLTALSDSQAGSATSNPPTQAQVEALRNRVNDILSYLQGGEVNAINGCINRVNDLLTALG